MYEEFFGLRARPFGITPSADLFFHSSAHRRTLAYLQGRVLASEPVIVLTGDIGAGKTTVLQVLLRSLSVQFVPAVVVSTQLDEVELTRSVLIAFGAAATGESLDELRTALRPRLEDLRSRRQGGLLVVDEAQNLSAGTLRYLMQLPELGGVGEDASLQVVISGQPGLQDLLVEAAGERAVHELPLCRLGPMSTIDTGAYVHHRLRVVSSTTDGPTFSDEAIDQVRVATGGLPRLVNRLCDRVLTSAYLDRTRDIDAVRVAGAAAELREELGDSGVNLAPFEDDHQAEQAVPPRSLPTPPVPTVVDAGVDSAPAPADAASRTPAQHVGPGGPEPSPRGPPKRPESQADDRRRRYWAAAAAAGFLVVSFGWLAYDRSSPRNTTRLGATAPAIVVAPAPRADPAGDGHAAETNTKAPSAENSASALRSDARLPAKPAGGRVREPAGPTSQPVDAQAALGLRPTEPTAAPPVTAPPVTAPPVTAPPVTAPPVTAPPVAAPPVAEPACSEATKALGLCP